MTAPAPLSGTARYTSAAALNTAAETPIPCAYRDGCTGPIDTTVALAPLWEVFACRPCADLAATR